MMMTTFYKFKLREEVTIGSNNIKNIMEKIA